MTLGWQCPACGTVYAPHIASCPKPHAAMIAASGGNVAAPASSHGVGSRDSSPKPRAQHTYTEDFERFFKIYPNNRGKFAASKRFAAAVASGISVDVLCRAAAAYRDDPSRNPDKTKHAEGWLTARRWEDDLTPVRAVAPK